MNVLKKTVTSCITILFVACLAASIMASDASAKTYNQKESALKPYTAKNYTTVKNTRYVIPKYTYNHDYSGILKTNKGFSASFRHEMYIDSPNPQCAVVTPDGKYLYVVDLKDHGGVMNYNARGRLLRYDLEALRKDNEGSLPSDVDIDDSKYVKTGPWIVFGHCQSLAYNPKNGTLWFIAKPGNWKSSIKQIDLNTFTVKNTINFKLKKTVKMGFTLAFDKRGNAYFYTSSKNGNWCPKNSIKIYKGKVEGKKVKWELVMQGIRWANGPRNGGNNIIQNLGYNPKTDRLYFVSDNSIMSVPAAKIGHLKKNDVRESVFKSKREFEGITFDKKGRGFFLTNRPSEVMSTGKGF